LEIVSHHRIKLLAIEQTAWDLAGKDNRCVVVDTWTELDWSMKNNEVTVWAPSKMILDAVNKPSLKSEPLDLAIWLADEFKTDYIYHLGPESDYPNVQLISSPDFFK
jgi:dihydroneopterin aldolase